MATLLQEKYEARKAEVNARFEQLRANEEELNRIFAKIYNMEGEVPIEVEDKYVSAAFRIVFEYHPATRIEQQTVPVGRYPVGRA